jgi:hypothetical protein
VESGLARRCLARRRAPAESGVGPMRSRGMPAERTTPVRLVRFELVPAFNFLWGAAIALYLFCT